MKTRLTRSSLAAAEVTKEFGDAVKLEETPGPARTPRKSSRTKTPLSLKKNVTEDPADLPKSGNSRRTTPAALGTPRARRLSNVSSETSSARLTRSTKSVKNEESESVEKTGRRTRRIHRVSKKSSDGEASIPTEPSATGSPRRKSSSPEKTLPASPRTGKPSKSVDVVGEPVVDQPGEEAIEPSATDPAQISGRRSPKKAIVGSPKTRRKSEKTSSPAETLSARKSLEDPTESPKSRRQATALEFPVKSGEIEKVEKSGRQTISRIRKASGKSSDGETSSPRNSSSSGSSRRKTNSPVKTRLATPRTHRTRKLSKNIDVSGESAMESSGDESAVDPALRAPEMKASPADMSGQPTIVDDSSGKGIMELSSDEDLIGPTTDSPSRNGGINKLEISTPGSNAHQKSPNKALLRSGTLLMEVPSDDQDSRDVQVSLSRRERRKSKGSADSKNSSLNAREAPSEKTVKDQQMSELSASIADVSLSSYNSQSKKNNKKNKGSVRVSPDRQSDDLRIRDISNKTAESEVTIRRRGGGTIIESRPVFSDDAKYVYLNCGWGVRVFSVETGECVRVFDAFSKDFKVVNCFCWNTLPAALTSDGVFIAWDPRSGKTQQKVRMHVRTTEIVVDGIFIPCEDSAPFLCLVIESKEHTNLRMYSGSNFRSLAGHPLSARKVDHPYKQHSLSVGGDPKQPFIAYVESRKGIRVINLQNKTFFRNSNPPDKYWTCIRAHPAEDTIAAGDSIGRIVVFRNLRSSHPGKNHAVNSVYHWHTLPVCEIAFTPAGSSMYSGGGELTLVKWNVENPQVRHFLPRMSADIVHIAISPYNQMVAVATKDNGVQIVTPTNKLQCILQQFSWSVIATEQERMFPSGLLYDPRSRGLILNSRPGHLQLYSPHSETLTYNIDVTMMNYLTQERNKVIVNTQVTHSALSSDGLWLATVETRYEPGLALELRLKFWNYSSEKKRFILATVIDMPHDDQVHTIKFSPGPTKSGTNESIEPDTDVVLVSTGADRKMRLWSKRPIDSIYHKGDTWRCQNACFYRDQPCGPCSFSYDGSVLAVGFGAAVTLWDVDNVVLKHSLATSAEHIKFVEFGRDECCNMLLCASESTVMGWDLLKLVLSWKVNLKSALFVADPFSSFVAVFTVGNQWKILDAGNGEVVFTLNNEWKSELGDRPQKQQVLAAVFIPRHRPNTEAPKWMRNSYLYYIDVYQELNCLEPANEIAQLPTFQLALDKDSGTLFGSLVGAKSVREKSAEESSKSMGYGVLGARAVTQILTPAAHTLPPVNLLCASFLQSFVILKRDNLPDESDRDDKSEDDKTTVIASSDSEQEVDMPTFTAPTNPPKKSSSRPRQRQPPSGTPESTPEPMEVDAVDLKNSFPMLDEDEDEIMWRRKLQEPKDPEQTFIIDE